MITVKDIAWTAGFLEGEGHFSKKRSCIMATQVNKEPILKLQSLYGGHVRVLSRQKEGRSDAWRWELWGNKAIGLMMTLFPLLSQKYQDRIRHLIAWWRLPQGEKISLGIRRYHANRQSFTPADSPDGRVAL